MNFDFDAAPFDGPPTGPVPGLVMEFRDPVYFEEAIGRASQHFAQFAHRSPTVVWLGYTEYWQMLNYVRKVQPDLTGLTWMRTQDGRFTLSITVYVPWDQSKGKAVLM